MPVTLREKDRCVVCRTCTAQFWQAVLSAFVAVIAFYIYNGNFLADVGALS